MGQIRITKIDGQEFVTYKDYLRLKEENKKLKGSEQLKPSDYELVIANIKISDLEKENKEIKEVNNDLQDTLRWYEKKIERLEKKVDVLRYIIRR